MPLIISIPTLTFDIDYANSIDNTRSNVTMNNDNMGNEINSKMDITKTSVPAYGCASKSKQAISKTHTENRRSHWKQEKTCQVTNAIVELVDIFPTIADLAGIPIPICQVNSTDRQLHSRNIFTYQKEPIDPCSEGITLLPLVKDTLNCQVRQVLFTSDMLLHFIELMIFLFYIFCKTLEGILEEGSV